MFFKAQFSSCLLWEAFPDCHLPPWVFPPLPSRFHSSIKLYWVHILHLLDPPRHPFLLPPPNRAIPYLPAHQPKSVRRAGLLLGYSHGAAQALTPDRAAQSSRGWTDGGSAGVEMVGAAQERVSLQKKIDSASWVPYPCPPESHERGGAPPGDVPGSGQSRQRSRALCLAHSISLTHPFSI